MRVKNVKQQRFEDEDEDQKMSTSTLVKEGGCCGTISTISGFVKPTSQVINKSVERPSKCHNKVSLFE